MSEITITDAAIEAIKKHAKDRGGEPALRIGIRGGGCTGFAYLFEWLEEEKEHDTIIEREGVRIVIDPKSLVYLKGLELDFVKSLMQNGFQFNNPNVTGTCGCGEAIKF